MSEIICPLCGKPNSPDANECQYCHAPLKTGGFLAEPEGEQVAPPEEGSHQPSEHAPTPGPTSDLEGAVPDWLKETEANFLSQSDLSSEETTPGTDSEHVDSRLNPPASSPEPTESAIDDEWLASLLEQAGAVDNRKAKPSGKTPADLPYSDEGLGSRAGDEEPPAVPTSPAEKPDWLASLEASSKIKLEGGMFSSEPDAIPDIPVEPQEEKAPEPAEKPDWLIKPGIPPAENKPDESKFEAEESLAPAEIPGWLEPLRPSEPASPTSPVEDVSGADIVTAGPLVGLRGVISPQPSAIRPQKPPTYSIKLKVTEDQQTRLQMMEEMLEDEEKPKPLPAQPVFTSRYIFRLIVALALLLPIIWMIISGGRQSSGPQPGNVTGVVDFNQRVQALPVNAAVLVAFDYEAGFSGELNTAISTVLSQLMKKNAYLAFVATSPMGPALAESILKTTSTNLSGSAATYTNYANLGYIPGGTLGLLGLASSPRSILPYALNGSDVWSGPVLKPITAVKDFAAIIVIANDPDTARMWIEQVGPQLQEAGVPLLIISSAQAEPLIQPYYQASPSQVQGLLGGLTGGLAYAAAVGDYQPDGVWDAYSAGITISVLIILIGSVAGVLMKVIPIGKKKEP